MHDSLLYKQGTPTFLHCVYRTDVCSTIDDSKCSVSDPCQRVIQVPEDSRDCRAAGVRMRLSRWRGRSRSYMSASDAHFHTPAWCGGALKNTRDT